MPSAEQMLADFDNSYALRLTEMDTTHREFLSLCIDASSATGPAFGERFSKLFEHTQTHFMEEEQRMQESGFPSYAEHRADHQRILGDMERFSQRAMAGRISMARAWLADSLPSWFDLHAKTMDSALAAHLKSMLP